ncbi:DUF1345 domain-containing protein [Jatrophihabitans telluris]|uniref:DUF1345 domain-containing protein n=1 Tax=Jatrophihabitans telluris TaxID=2038343 RepID=A0ABY4QVL5_9ACTN|nr:DUF1345 domain-containing protein [Jatrophihabitans telluris]UQX87664.1 DUF1345 domain-containing protein [Jatrophihabitans telluris]
MTATEPTPRPAWRRPTPGEPRWIVAGSLLVAIALQTVMPSRFALHPKYLVSAITWVLLAGLVITHPDRMSRRSPRLRTASITLLVVIAAANAVSVVLLIRAIVSGHSLAARQLLLGGGAIWLINVIIFAQVYWEYDRGGPAARAAGSDDVPDLLFPQMGDDTLDPEWEPRFFDYLFVSYTNATAFSPTDTMPLSRWCKVLFMAQSSISLVTVGLIAARAVNILPNT